MNNNCDVEMTDAVKMKSDVTRVENGMGTAAVSLIYFICCSSISIKDTKLRRASSFFS